MILVGGLYRILDDTELKPMREWRRCSRGIPEDGVGTLIKAEVGPAASMHLVRVESAPFGRIGFSPDIMKLPVVSPIEPESEAAFQRLAQLQQILRQEA